MISISSYPASIPSLFLRLNSVYTNIAKFCSQKRSSKGRRQAIGLEWITCPGQRHSTWASIPVQYGTDGSGSGRGHSTSAVLHSARGVHSVATTKHGPCDLELHNFFLNYTRSLLQEIHGELLAPTVRIRDPLLQKGINAAMRTKHQMSLRAPVSNLLSPAP